MRKALGGSMKQQDAYKLLAAFMILIMIIVPVAYVITSPRSDSESQTTGQQSSQQDKYNPEFWTIDQPFYSITDALNMTPYGVVTADFVDIDGMTPQMTQGILQGSPGLDSLIKEADFIYKSNTTKLYYSRLNDGNNQSFLLLSTMYPPRNDFNYIVNPETYYNHVILIRQEQKLSGLINLMGAPVVLAPQGTALEVLGIITSLNKTTTAYDQYEGLLGKVEAAPYQTVSSNVTFAKQFYMGIRTTKGNYERTTAYMNVNSSTLKKLNGLKANSTKNGFEQYDLTGTGNYTYVRIVSPDLFSVLNEEIY